MKPRRELRMEVRDDEFVLDELSKEEQLQNFYKEARREFRNIGLLLIGYTIVMFGLAIGFDEENIGLSMIITMLAGVGMFFGYRRKYRDLQIENAEWSMLDLLKWLVALLALNQVVTVLVAILISLIDSSLLEVSAKMMEEITLSNSIFLLLYAIILGPIGEEIIFRGFILRAFERFGKVFAVLGSALLFGFFHGNVLQIPSAFAIGVVFGCATLRYSLKFAIVLHILNNLFAIFMARESWNFLMLIGAVMIVSMSISKYSGVFKKIYWENGGLDRKMVRYFFTTIPILFFLMLYSWLSVAVKWIGEK
jgi:Predicted metal-dependent membrane protease